VTPKVGKKVATTSIFKKKKSDIIIVQEVEMTFRNFRIKSWPILESK